ncbi:zincin [Aspergillus sclerotiicarbonarius CBS 121057]|uniref:Zincin n=1 Tax=Aspergillus sclerotiicarbonarius (strain CBS 121057 / IBT 28362) TaxID=1448318 RepID=A0A319EL70_ASPSB|nr:zincin [Aspergillus sclerotiicarbonarius CBS 121057]
MQTTTSPKHHHHPCTFIQPQLLHHISTSPSAPSQARAAATHTLTLTHEIHHTRASPSTTPILTLQLTPHPLTLAIHDCHHNRTLPGVLIHTTTTTSSSPSTTHHPTTNTLYTNLTITLHFLSSILGRKSIDNDNLHLTACLHYDNHLCNAFWTGREIIFGDGDGIYFSSFPENLDVVAHELMHGVTEYTAGLLYEGESGALSESISDVFACVITQWHLNQTVNEADWVVGRGIWAGYKGKEGGGGGGVALRSLKSPGTAYNDPVLGRDSQPDHMSGFVCTEEDNGGVHVNSGIPNRAFYCAAVGFGGWVWEKAAVVWYRTLLDPRVEPNCGFVRFACVTVDVAEGLFGAWAGGVVRRALMEVGVEVRDLVWTLEGF